MSGGAVPFHGIGGDPRRELACRAFYFQSGQIGRPGIWGSVCWRRWAFRELPSATTAPNEHLEVGYAPVQPVEFSHKLHAGDMGMDCRYCYFTVERSSFAAVPPTQVCMNCHSRVRTDSPKLLPVRESDALDKPIA
jgi:hypothetical protein